MMFNSVPNPTLIIGLGGTGKWVLTYVKKNLLDTYGGRIPKTVKLLSFDTTMEKVSRDGRPQEEDAHVGDVQLDKSEFFYLGGNIRQICLDIREKHSYPHISSWLQASNYLESLESDAFDISQGAGQKRPFGRMAIFSNLQSQTQNELTNLIRQAIIDVVAANRSMSAIEIYVVASLAGGTGSGMFIDVAHLARWYAEKQSKTGFAVRGFLALQNTFRSVITVDQVEANAAAAMRELDRFMLIFDQQYPIIYNLNFAELKTIYGRKNGKLFDNCYLLDAARDRIPLDGIQPKYGVYPSIADCITMLLDSSTGDAYGQHYKNVNNRIAQAQTQTGLPMYSSLGTYSLILPIEDIITSLTYRFATEILSQHLLRIRHVRDDHGREQLVFEYDGDPQRDAMDFLRMPRSGSGIDNTQFVINTSGVVERSIDEVAYQREIADMSSGELLTWVLPPESDPAVAKIAKDVREVLQTLLQNQVQASNVEGDDYITGCDRVATGASRFKNDYLGREIAGKRQGGKYREALEKCVGLQRQRYKTLLQELLLNLLNGPDVGNRDFQTQRRGKLGYTQHLLIHLSQAFDRMGQFFNKVRAYRANTDELRIRGEDVARLRQEMENTKTRSSFLGTFIKSIHPAVKAQQGYLEAEQILIDYEINELMIEAMRQIADELRRATEDHKAAIDSWISSLAYGFSGSFTDPGAYRSLQDATKRHSAYREEKKNIRVHEYISDPAYEERLYVQCAQSKHEEVLSHLTWEIDTSSTTFKLALTSSTVVRSERLGSDIRGLTPVVPGSPVGVRATERNTEFLLGLARAYFIPLRAQTITERLHQLTSAADLAMKLDDKCSPMVRIDTNRQGQQELSRFVCVNPGRDGGGFVGDFSSAFRRLGAQNRENQVLLSTNPYTCTVLNTIDAISSVGLLPYIAAEDAYNKYQGDARLLHIFPAEVNAVELEQRLPLRIHEPRRKFHPRLTAMLENRKQVEQFILCKIYGFIKIESAGGFSNRYILTYTPSTAGRRSLGRFELAPAERSPSLFTAMETFIFQGTDVNSSAAPIDFDQLEIELRTYEAQATGGRVSVDRRRNEINIEGGNDSQLINLLEESLIRDAEPLRRSHRDIERDLGSVMILFIDEIIEGLHARLRAFGFSYDPNARPLTEKAPYHMRGLVEGRIERQTARDFLSRAGLTVIDDEHSGFSCQSNDLDFIWKELTPFHAHLVVGRGIELDDFVQIRETIQRRAKPRNENITLLVIDQTPTHGQLHQIFGFQESTSTTIVPISQALMAQSLLDGREMQVLLDQIDVHKGRRDLYNTRDAVTDVLSFFGRSAQISELRSLSLRGKSTMLFGIRKIGKSSLLGHMRETSIWPVAMIDLEAYPEPTSEHLCAEIFNLWTNATGKLYPELSLEDIIVNLPTSFTLGTFREMTINLLEVLAGHEESPGLLLFLDEMEILFRQPYYLELAGILRGIAERPDGKGRFSVVMAGLDPQINRVDYLGVEQKNNPFFSFFQEIRVPPLSAEDTEQMIASIGGLMGITFTKNAMRILVSLAGGHPFLTRQICSLIAQNSGRPLTVEPDLVRHAVEAYLQDFSNYIAMSLWNIEGGGPGLIEQQILCRLVVTEMTPEAELLEMQLPGVERYQYKITLERLRNRSLVAQSTQGYSLTIPLYREWIRRNIIGDLPRSIEDFI